MKPPYSTAPWPPSPRNRPTHVAGRRGLRVLVDPASHGGISLRDPSRSQDAALGGRQGRREINRGGRLPDPPFDLRQRYPIHGDSRLGPGRLGRAGEVWPVRFPQMPLVVQSGKLNGGLARTRRIGQRRDFLLRTFPFIARSRLPARTNAPHRPRNPPGMKERAPSRYRRGRRVYRFRHARAPISALLQPIRSAVCAAKPRFLARGLDQREPPFRIDDGERQTRESGPGAYIGQPRGPADRAAGSSCRAHACAHAGPIANRRQI